MSTTKKKSRFTTNISVGGGGMELSSLRTMAQTYPQEFMQRCQALIDSGELRWQEVRDLKAFFNAMVDVEIPVRVMLHGQQRTIMSSAFPVLSGNLSVAEISDSYDSVAKIADQLVTDRDSAKETMTIVGLLAEVGDTLSRKQEGDPYPLIGAGEERFDIGSNPKGLRMQITQEMIDRNDVDGVIDRLNNLGEIPADEIEEQTLRRVTDHDGSGTTPAEPYALHLNKAGVALYQTDNDPLNRLPTAAQSLNGVAGNRLTNNALVDHTSLGKLRLQLASMKNSRGKKIAIPVSECVLLLPESLRDTADVILASMLVPGSENEMNPWGPRGAHRPKVLSSPKLDELSTSAYYLGRFMKQFRRKWALRMEMVTMSGDLATYLRSRVAFEARVAWDCEVGAVEYNQVVQSLAGTTAPKA